MHYIEKEVLRLTKKHKTKDPFEICSLEKIICLERDMHSEINGVYQYIQRNRFIFINSNLSVEEKYRTCAHELGHAILHRKYNCAFLKRNTLFSINRFEKEADLFSSVLLTPEITKDMLYDKTLEELSYELNVPVDLLKLRLEINPCLRNS